MPVEIRELQINVTVNQQGTSTNIPAKTSGTGTESDEEEKKALIDQCVEQVLEIFSNKKER